MTLLNKHCRFCGQDYARLETRYRAKGYREVRAVCVNCGASGPAVIGTELQRTELEAAAAWNAAMGDTERPHVHQPMVDWLDIAQRISQGDA